MAENVGIMTVRCEHVGLAALFDVFVPARAYGVRADGIPPDGTVRESSCNHCATVHDCCGRGESGDVVDGCHDSVV